MNEIEILGSKWEVKEYFVPEKKEEVELDFATTTFLQWIEIWNKPFAYGQETCTS
jgi:hypothetical protein